VTGSAMPRRRLRPWVIVVGLLILGAGLFVSPFASLPLDRAGRSMVAPLHLATITDVTPAAEPVASPVTVAAGEDPVSLVASWPEQATPAAATVVSVYIAAPHLSVPVATVPVAAGLHAVALPPLPAGTTDVVTVTVTGAGGSSMLGPSAPFPSVPVPHSVTAASGAGRPCEGAGYGLGRVTIDDYTGFQGSYCEPPGFTSGTGAFCADHALAYPSGASGYRWASSVVGGNEVLINQYGRAANPADVARLGWIYGTWGSTSDPARAVAIGAITHAVMGDYPGLAVADLDPPRLAVTGGDPTTIKADVESMWHASGRDAGPYAMKIDPGAGPFTVGGSYRGRVSLTGRGGGAETGIPITVSGSSVHVVPDQPATTGPDGSLSFTWSPTAATMTLAATSGVSLPGSEVTLWHAVTAPVAVQRVLTSAGPTTPATSISLTANAPASLTLLKASADAAWVPVGAGFDFDVAQRTGPEGVWQTVAQRSTAADGTMTPVGGLLAGPYRITESAHPPAFLPGGPWEGQLASGQDTKVVLTDQVATRPVTIAKIGENPLAQPIGAGVNFEVSYDPTASGTFATPVGTWTTGADGTTPARGLAPGRYQATETTPPPGYRLAPPATFTVAPMTAADLAAPGGGVQTVSMQDLAIRGVMKLKKLDADSGAVLPGAVLTVTTTGASDPSPTGPLSSSSPSSSSPPSSARPGVEVGAGTSPATAPASAGRDGARTIGTWTTGAEPIDVADLLAGTYVVTEVAAPPGYQLPNSASQTVTLAPGQSLAVTLADHRIPPAPPAAAPSPPLPAALAITAPSLPSRGMLAMTGLPLWRLTAAGLLLAMAGAIVLFASRRQGKNCAYRSPRQGAYRGGRR